MIETFADVTKRPEVGNAFEFVNFFGGPPESLLAFPIQAVLTDARAGDSFRPAIPGDDWRGEKLAAEMAAASTSH